MSDTGLHSATGDGLLVGVSQAKTPDQLRAEQAALAAANRGDSNFVPMVPTAPTPQFTAEDIERARVEERTKLYPQLQAVDEMRAELDAIKAEREAALKAKEEADKAAAEAARKAEEDSMDVRQLLTRKDEEWNQRFAEVEAQRARAELLLEKERELAALTEYRNKRVGEVGDSVIPALQKYIGGNTPEEIEASIADVTAQTQEILAGFAQAQQQAWSGMRGTAPTAPAGGPLENVPDDRVLTNADIAAMTPAEYARHRGNLLKASSQQFYGQRR